MGYSAFDPTTWLVFIGCCAIIWLTVKIFRVRHPDYPGKLYSIEKGDKS